MCPQIVLLIFLIPSVRMLSYRVDTDEVQTVNGSSRQKREPASSYARPFHSVSGTSNQGTNNAGHCESVFQTMNWKVVKMDPSPSDTEFSRILRKTLQDFRSLVVPSIFVRRKERINSMQIKVLKDVIKHEIFTFLSGNHFVFRPVLGVHEPKWMYENVERFISRWFNPSTAGSANAEYNEIIDSQVFNYYTYTELTENDYRSLIHNIIIEFGKRYPSVNITNTNSPRLRSPMATITGTVDETWRPKIYFTFDDVRKNRFYDPRSSAIREWINNYVVRKYLLHDYMLNGVMPPVKSNFGPTDIDSFEDYFRAQTILNLAKQHKTFKCLYVDTMNKLAEIFESRHYPAYVLEEFKNAFKDVAENNRTLKREIKVEFKKVSTKKLFYTRVSKV